MPFAYFGAKKALARYYPPPAFNTIIEPFAGSAGYALHYATPKHRVILVERNPVVAELWRRIQTMSVKHLLSIECPPIGQRCDEYLITFIGGAGGADRKFHDRVVTPRMYDLWPVYQKAIARSLPRIRNWTIIEGDYTDAPNINATWFVDPPYWVPPGEAGKRGDGYKFGASQLDFDALGAWCKSRQGQITVCEQDGATWLPFRPLYMMTTGACIQKDNDARRKLEVVWTRTPGFMLATPRAKAAKDAAAKARSQRLAR